MTLAGGFVPLGDERADWKFPLQLGRCSKCTLMQTLQDIDPDVLFSQYSYASSSSVALTSHFEQLSTILGSKMDLAGRLCIDVGCNDGILLRPLRRLGTQVLGIDPSDVARESSKKFQFNLVNKYLTPSVAREVREQYGIPRVITACNVLAHVRDPHLLVEGLSILSGLETVILVEVHYQGALLKENQYDTVYHEHTCYYSLASLDHLLRQHGLEIKDAGVIPNHGGSIRVFAGLSKGLSRTSLFQSLFEMEEKWDVRKFQMGARVMRDALIAEVQHRKESGRTIYGYGASGRGTILLNWCGFTPREIDLVVDRSPLRFGKVVPGVKIPIRSVDEISFGDSSGRYVFEDPDIFLLTAWNYAHSIKSQHPLYQGAWLAPLPTVRFV